MQRYYKIMNIFLVLIVAAFFVDAQAAAAGAGAIPASLANLAGNQATVECGVCLHKSPVGTPACPVCTNPLEAPRVGAGVAAHGGHNNPLSALAAQIIDVGAAAPVVNAYASLAASAATARAGAQQATAVGAGVGAFFSGAGFSCHHCRKEIQFPHELAEDGKRTLIQFLCCGHINHMRCFPQDKNGHPIIDNCPNCNHDVAISLVSQEDKERREEELAKANAGGEETDPAIQCAVCTEHYQFLTTKVTQPCSHQMCHGCWSAVKELRCALCGRGTSARARYDVRDNAQAVVQHVAQVQRAAPQPAAPAVVVLPAAAMGAYFAEAPKAGAGAGAGVVVGDGAGVVQQQMAGNNHCAAHGCARREIQPGQPTTQFDACINKHLHIFHSRCVPNNKGQCPACLAMPMDERFRVTDEAFAKALAAERHRVKRVEGSEEDAIIGRQAGKGYGPGDGEVTCPRCHNAVRQDLLRQHLDLHGQQQRIDAGTVCVTCKTGGPDIRYSTCGHSVHKECVVNIASERSSGFEECEICRTKDRRWGYNYDHFQIIRSCSVELAANRLVQDAPLFARELSFYCGAVARKKPDLSLERAQVFFYFPMQANWLRDLIDRVGQPQGAGQAAAAAAPADEYERKEQAAITQRRAEDMVAQETHACAACLGTQDRVRSRTYDCGHWVHFAYGKPCRDNWKNGCLCCSQHVANVQALEKLNLPVADIVGNNTVLSYHLALVTKNPNTEHLDRGFLGQYASALVCVQVRFPIQMGPVMAHMKQNQEREKEAAAEAQRIADEAAAKEREAQRLREQAERDRRDAERAAAQEAERIADAADRQQREAQRLAAQRQADERARQQRAAQPAPHAAAGAGARNPANNKSLVWQLYDSNVARILAVTVSTGALLGSNRQNRAAFARRAGLAALAWAWGLSSKSGK